MTKTKRWLRRRVYDRANSNEVYLVESVSMGVKSELDDYYQVYIILKPLKDAGQNLRRTETYFTFMKSMEFMGELVFKIYEFVRNEQDGTEVYVNEEGDTETVYSKSLFETLWLDVPNEFPTLEDATNYLDDIDSVAAEHARQFAILPVWLAPIQK